MSCSWASQSLQIAAGRCQAQGWHGGRLMARETSIPVSWRHWFSVGSSLDPSFRTMAVPQSVRDKFIKFLISSVSGVAKVSSSVWMHRWRLNQTVVLKDWSGIFAATQLGSSLSNAGTPCLCPVLTNIHSNCPTTRPNMCRRSMLVVGGWVGWRELVAGESAPGQGVTSTSSLTVRTEMSPEGNLRGMATEWRSRLWLLGVSRSHGLRRD